MNNQNNVRREMMAAIITVMAEADAAGKNAFDAARCAFPGTPSIILEEAFAEAVEDEPGAWWRNVPQTVAPEAIGEAVAELARTSPPSVVREIELTQALDSVF